MFNSPSCKQSIRMPSERKGAIAGTSGLPSRTKANTLRAVRVHDQLTNVYNVIFHYFFFFPCVLATNDGYGTLWFLAHCLARFFSTPVMWWGLLLGSGLSHAGVRFGMTCLLMDLYTSTSCACRRSFRMSRTAQRFWFSGGMQVASSRRRRVCSAVSCLGIALSTAYVSASRASSMKVPK